jgi:hypothetical protein
LAQGLFHLLPLPHHHGQPRQKAEDLAWRRAVKLLLPGAHFFGGGGWDEAVTKHKTQPDPYAVFCVWPRPHQRLPSPIQNARTAHFFRRTPPCVAPGRPHRVVDF